MSKAIDDARQLIQSRLADIDAEAGQLRRALAGMGERGGRRRRPGRPPKRAGAVGSAPARPKRRAAAKQKAGRRAARGQRREELLAAIRATPGARPSELAASIGIGASQVHPLIAKARTEKLIVKSGKGYALRG